MLLGVVGGIVVLGAVAVAIAYEKTPVPTAALAATGFSQSVVYSKDGSLIGRFGTTNRKMLQYNEIPADMINAVVAAEDRNFFNEGGISPTGIARAAYEDLTGNDGSLQGGSTITQEFVRQYYSGIGTQQTFSRKIKEIFVAMKVAKEKSKQWILTNYLNTIYLGQGAYGIEAAAETYYGKPSAKLTVAQDAVIAAIIQQPSTYPLPQYRTQLEARWHYVLNGMVQMGTLTEQKAAAMKFPAPGNHVPQTLGRDVWDPYVLNMVQTELERHLPPVAGADLQRRLRHPHHRRRQEDGGAVRGRPRERSADQREQPSVHAQLHARGRGARGSRQRRDPGRVRRARLHRVRSTTGPARSSPRSSARRSSASGTWRCRTGSRSGPRSSRTSWPPRSRRA